MQRQAADEFPLAPAVAFPKRMQSIDLRKIIYQPDSKTILLQPMQIILRFQLPKNLLRLFFRTLEPG